MTTKLQIYNGALQILGETRLASLSEARKPRYELDLVYDDGGLRACLEQGMWNFAVRSTERDYDSGIDPSFGYNRAFPAPDDFVRSVSVCSDPYFRVPLLAYSFEKHHWFCDLDKIYVRYVSDDEDYGMNIGEWPESFTEMVKAYFAMKTAKAICGGDEAYDKANEVYKKALSNARSKDAIEDPTSIPALGFWAGSRSGSRNRNDRGNSGSLIG